MRGSCGVVAAFLLLVSLCSRALASEAPPALPAKAWLLMDAASKQVLAEENGHLPLPTASTTKVMTAILTLERGNLTDVVTAGQKPYNTGGSTIYLELGEKQTLKNLLYALMLESANDAAVAVAEHLAGSEEAFAGWMNERALALGAGNTRYKNSHGLHQEGHYSTAYDQALIAQYAMQNKEFRDLVAVEEIEIPGSAPGTTRRLYNRNRLLGYYDGANGVKNGFTEEAGLTNVASAKRGDTELIAVILGAENRVWTSSMALLDYGFANFRSHVAARKGDVLGPAAVAGSKPVAAVVAADLAVSLPIEQPRPERRVVWEPNLKAPLDGGARLGQVQFLEGGKVIAAADLVAPFPVLPERSARSERRANSTANQQSIVEWYWVAMIAGILLVTNATFRRLRRRRGENQNARPHGRDRLYEIRNRRRL